MRVRLVGAHLAPPDSFAFEEGFTDPTTTVFAALVDYTFGEHFDEVDRRRGLTNIRRRQSCRARQ